MSQSPEWETLSDSRSHVVCLRVLVHAQRGLIYIELIGDVPELHGRFATWAETAEVIQAWLESQTKSTT